MGGPLLYAGFDALKDELSFHWGEHHHLGPVAPPPPPPLNGHDDTHVRIPSVDSLEQRKPKHLPRKIK